MSLDPSFTEQSLATNAPLSHVFNYVPSSRRNAYAAVIALDEQLGRATTAINDPEPRIAKLAWWRDEFARIASGDAVHPVVRELVRLPGVRAETPLFEQLLGAVAGEISTIRFDTAEELSAHARARQGPIQVLAAHALSFPDAPTASARKAATRLGEAWWITLSICGRGNVDVALIAERDDLAKEARALYKSVTSDMADEPTALRSVFAVQAAIGELMLDTAIATTDKPIVRIPALRATWRAWRAARNTR